MTGNNTKVSEVQVTAEKKAGREMLLVCSIATEAAASDLLRSACMSQLVLCDPHALASLPLCSFNTDIRKPRVLIHAA